MTTLEPPELRQFARAWEDFIDSAELRNDAATFSGIVGDLQHRLEGGYHISRQDQPSDNYSCQLPEDREGRADDAAAVDMNMMPKDMTLVTGRLLKSAKDKNDPRLDCVREFFGTLDGKVVTGWDCYNYEPSSSDDSHLWHLHMSILRKFVRDAVALRGPLSVIKGETVEQWRSGGGTTGGDNDMQLDDVVKLADGRDKPVRFILMDTEQLRNYLIGDGKLPAGYPTEGSPLDILLKAAKAQVKMPTAAEIAAEIIKQLKGS